MDVKKIEIFLSVVEHGNLTLAAEEVGYTQSGVSHIIKNLEEEMGFPLLLRFHTGVAPTEEAKRLIPIMRKLTSWGDQLEQVVASINGLETGIVRVGALSSITANWMPTVLKEFSRDHPNIDVRIIGGEGNGEIAEWLEQGKVDLGLYGFTDNKPFERIPLMEDTMLAILPNDHPLAKLERIPIKSFHGVKFITIPENLHDEAHDLLRRHRTKPDFSFITCDDLSIITMVEMGLGVSIFPQLMMRCYSHCNVKMIPLDPPSTRTLGIVVRSIKNTSPASKLFISYTKRIVERLLKEKKT
ncbi:LysR family transcriptional regulator [Eubacteriales bacterium OttesenSCG-928-K08]|nr:LysR family transcriptional regulator [Eubacteriales bacterium OttesenSCG-928-K08]